MCIDWCRSSKSENDGKKTIRCNVGRNYKYDDYNIEQIQNTKLKDEQGNFFRH